MFASRILRCFTKLRDRGSFRIVHVPLFFVFLLDYLPETLTLELEFLTQLVKCYLNLGKCNIGFF